MSHFVRPGLPCDIDALYDMAKLGGAGFTNLPPDREALAARLARSEAAFTSTEEQPGDHLYMLMLENGENGRLVGTAQIFARLGDHWPFYSYRMGTLTQTSKELGRTFRAETLTLATDLDGSSEVGGLFLHPGERASGLGLLMARSRYLFIRNHRARFADRVISDLRGVSDEAGNSPFWDALGGKFFQMSFREADEFNALNGNQFIGDLMPRHPIYTAMLPDAARAVIGMPHPSGRPAMRMLEQEGFIHDGYVDIFDAGPTMCVATDRLRTVAEARDARISTITEDAGGEAVLAARGRLLDFRCTLARVRGAQDIAIDAAAAQLLAVAPGDMLTLVAR